MRTSLGALLVKTGVASEQEVADAIEEGRGTGERLGEWMIRKGLATDERIAELLAEQWQLRYSSADALQIDEVAALRISRSVARKLAAHPVSYDGDAIVMAIAEPREELFAKVAKRVGEASYVVVSRSTLESLLGAPLERERDDEPLEHEPESVFAEALELADEHPATELDPGDHVESTLTAEESEDLPVEETVPPDTDFPFKSAFFPADTAFEPIAGIEVGASSSATTALVSIHAALGESELRVREAMELVSEALRLAQEQIDEQRIALAAVDDARERDALTIRDLELVVSEQNELFSAIREQTAALTASVDRVRSS